MESDSRVSRATAPCRSAGITARRRVTLCVGQGLAVTPDCRPWVGAAAEAAEEIGDGPAVGGHVALEDLAPVERRRDGRAGPRTDGVRDDRGVAARDAPGVDEEPAAALRLVGGAGELLRRPR